jgi:hypothetical protein
MDRTDRNEARLRHKESHQKSPSRLGHAPTFAEAVAADPPRRPGQLLQDMLLESQGAPWIYFITDGEAIKVGSAICVESRCRELQVSHYRELRIIGKLRGTRKQERALHMRWGRFRIRGEWFRDAPEIRHFMETGKHKKR